MRNDDLTIAKRYFASALPEDWGYIMSLNSLAAVKFHLTVWCPTRAMLTERQNRAIDNAKAIADKAY